MQVTLVYTALRGWGGRAYEEDKTVPSGIIGLKWAERTWRMVKLSYKISQNWWNCS